MSNRLPEKLKTLRDHCGYAQGDMASKLGVTVEEYMDWENGNKLCTVNKLKEIAAVYKIPLDQLIDNTKEVDLPRIETADDSVSIPFMKDVEAPKGAAPIYSGPISQTAEIHEQEAQPATGDTIQVGKVSEDTMDTSAFEKTTVNRIVDTDTFSASEDDDDDYEEELKPKKKKAPKNTDSEKKSSFKLDKKTLSIIIIAAAAVLVIVLVLTLKGCSSSGSGSTKNTVGSDNRLALADSFSLYVTDDGTVKSYGNAPSVSEFTSVTQVSAGSNFALGLKKNGSVVCSGSDTACDVSKWKNVTMVAAGSNHSVGLKSDGTVVCTGTSAACEVDKWTDVSKVYAGGDVTVGLKKDNTLLISGSVSSASQLSSLTGISDVTVGTNQIAVISDGKVTCYAIGSGSTSSTSSWTNISQVALGDDYAAGLTKSGTVQIASTNSDYAATAGNWTGVKYVAGRGATLIAVGSDNTVIGCGDNSKSVYGSNGTSSTAAATTAAATATPTPSPTPTASSKLAKVTNFNYSFDSNGMNLSWDKVTGAQYYEVTINTNPSTTVKSPDAGTKISKDKLTSGTTYTVTIVTVAKSASDNSDPYSYNVTYNAVAAKLGTVTGINCTIGSDNKLAVTWKAVTGADSYAVVFMKDGGQLSSTTVTGTSASVDVSESGTYNATVQALSSNTASYTAGDAQKGNDVSFMAQAKDLAAPQITGCSAPDTGKTVTVTFNGVENASSYTATCGPYTGSVSESNGSYVATFDLSAAGDSSGTWDVTVTAVGDGTKYNSSKTTRSAVYSITGDSMTIYLNNN